MARTKAYDPDVVLNQMRAVFLAKGYESTSMADLMVATGLNKKSIYNEFGNKETLFLTVLADYSQTESNIFTPILRNEPLGQHNLTQFFNVLYDRFHDTGCLLTLSLNEANCITEDALDLINQVMLKLEEGFFVNLQATGAFSDIESSMLARNLLALMQGYASLTRSTRLRENNQKSIDQFITWLMEH